MSVETTAKLAHESDLWKEKNGNGFLHSSLVLVFFLLFPLLCPEYLLLLYPFSLGHAAANHSLVIFIFPCPKCNLPSSWHDVPLSPLQDCFSLMHRPPHPTEQFSSIDPAASLFCPHCWGAEGKKLKHQEVGLLLDLSPESWMSC